MFVVLLLLQVNDDNVCGTALILWAAFKHLVCMWNFFRNRLLYPKQIKQGFFLV